MKFNRAYRNKNIDQKTDIDGYFILIYLLNIKYLTKHI